MDKKVLLKQLVDSGSNIRREFIPTAIVSTEGKYPVGEFWDANKILEVIASSEGGDVEALRALVFALQERIAILENNAMMKGEDDIVNSEQITDGTIKMQDLNSEVADKLRVDIDEDEEHAIFGL